MVAARKCVVIRVSVDQVLLYQGPLASGLQPDPAAGDHATADFAFPYDSDAGQCCCIHLAICTGHPAAGDNTVQAATLHLKVLNV